MISTMTLRLYSHRTRWRCLLSALSGSILEHGDGLEHILSLYAERDKFYHGYNHIAQCLVELKYFKDVPKILEIEFALWMHDVVYDPESKHNELNSANMAVDMLRDLYTDESVIRRVWALIMCTKDHCPGNNLNKQIMCDIDLSILGHKELYPMYAKNIRKEFSMFSESDYIIGRAKFLRGLLSKPKIYHTDVFMKKYEIGARVNILDEVTKLIKYTRISKRQIYNEIKGI